MPDYSRPENLDEMPETFVSTTAISRKVSLAYRAGRLRKLASRLYSRNFEAPPEELVKDNLWSIVQGYFPGALIADRTALEGAPAQKDGSVFLISSAGRQIQLPGHLLRPRRGHGPLVSDRPFLGGLFICSTARALLENMRPSRARNGAMARTLSRAEMELHLDKLIRQDNEQALRRLLGEAQEAGRLLDMQEEARELEDLVNILLGTRPGRLLSHVAKARRRGRPHDPQRRQLFQRLQFALRNHPPMTRPSRSQNPEQKRHLAFFEAYFSNFIEGIEFTVEEARDIVEGKLPGARPEEARDIVGSWQIIQQRDSAEPPRHQPENARALERRLQDYHATLMQARPAMRPGKFKQVRNRSGETLFVAPELVRGTLEQGLALGRSLETPFQHAVFMMFLITEVHPFADGNGRIARIMMNAELVAAGEERIIIPTVYRNNYLAALKALSLNENPQPLIQVLDYAQRWTAAVQWRTWQQTLEELESCNAFLNPDAADQQGRRLQMPGAM